MIDAFISLAIQNGSWMELDRQYLANKIYELVSGDIDLIENLSGKEMAELLAKKASKDESVQYMVFLQLLEMLTPPPSVVNAYFAEHYHKSPQEATQYYYELLKNIGFFETSGAKTVEDFLDFYAEGAMPSMNNRFIRMNLSGQSWGFQILPNSTTEEGIIFPEFPAQYSTISKVLKKALEVTEVFPHYQVRTNSAWFDLSLVSPVGDSGEMVSIDTPLTDLEIFEKENIFVFSGYNQEELIQWVKKIDYKDYRYVTALRQENKFSLQVQFENQDSYQKNLRNLVR